MAGRSVSNRFHTGLTTSAVSSANLASLIFELKFRVQGHSGWQLIKERNRRFQEFAVQQISCLTETRGQFTLFAYSYAARAIFQLARRRGWRTVLGQIDPGPAGEEVARFKKPHFSGNDLPAPPAADYWVQWRAETELADLVVVNSEWSRRAMLEQGVPSDKLQIIPIAYENSRTLGFTRVYPERFTSERPLRVLFLGQINPRKGIRAVFDAVRLTKRLPIEFWLVGPMQVKIPNDLLQHNRLKCTGTVRREAVADWYQKADVFLFPTLSDGFGITQLEAQAWRLPVVASRFCGSVVQHEVNGLVLTEVNGAAIAEALVGFLHSPFRLRQMSDQAGISQEFTLTSLGSSLINL